MFEVGDKVYCIDPQMLKNSSSLGFNTLEVDKPYTIMGKIGNSLLIEVFGFGLKSTRFISETEYGIGFKSIRFISEKEYEISKRYDKILKIKNSLKPEESKISNLLNKIKECLKLVM